MDLITNNYQLNIQPKAAIHIYDVKIFPNLAQTWQKRAVLARAKKQLTKLFEVYLTSGENLFSTLETRDPITIEDIEGQDGQNYQIEIQWAS